MKKYDGKYDIITYTYIENVLNVLKVNVIGNRMKYLFRRLHNCKWNRIKM